MAVTNAQKKEILILILCLRASVVKCGATYPEVDGCILDRRQELMRLAGGCDIAGCEMT